MENFNSLSSISLLKGNRSVLKGTVKLLFIFLFTLFIFNPWHSSAQVNLWGMTSTGGTQNDGVIFNYTGGGSLGTQTSLTGGSSACSPYGSLVKASDGNLYGMSSTGGANGLGEIFKYTPGSGLTTMLSFSGSTGSYEGANPYGSLLQATDGNLYGMTYAGGANNLGEIFQYAPGASTLTVEISLTGTGGSNPGANPYGSLMQASNGNLYGMTYAGGSNGGTTGLGVLFQYIPGGAYTPEVSFNGASSPAGGKPIGSLMQASDGNLYGMTSGGGNGGISPPLGVLFQYTLAGVYTAELKFYPDNSNSTTNGANPTGSLIQARDGNLYGMTWRGGQYQTWSSNEYMYGINTGYGIIFQYTLPSNGNTFTQEVYFTGTSGAYGNPLGSLMLASDGNLYGMTEGVGASGTGSKGAVFQYVPGTQSLNTVVLFSGTSGSALGAAPMYGNLIDLSPQTTSACQPTITGPVAACPGTQQVYTTESGMSSYQWAASGSTNIAGSTAYQVTVTWGSGTGNQTVNVTYTNSGASCTGSSSLNVSAYPVASATPNPVCSGSTTTLGLITDGTGTIQWYSSPDNSTWTAISGATTTSYTTGALTATTYYYAIVTGGTCGSSVQSNTVTVNVSNIPTAPTGMSGIYTICNGQSFTLTATGGTTGTGSTYEWGTGSVVGTNPISGATSVSYTASPGITTTYWVGITDPYLCLGVGTSGLTGGVAQTVTVNTSPATPTITGGSTICQGGSVLLTASTGTSITYQWQNGSGNIDGQTASTYSATTGGTYAVVATNNGCPSTSSSATLTNGTTPTVAITNPAAVCSGVTVDLTASAVTSGSDANLSFSYWTDSGASSPLSSPSAVAVAGTYYIEGTNSSGCTAIQPVAVTINQATTTPSASHSIDGSTLTLSATGGSGTTLQWYTDDCGIENGGTSVGSCTPLNIDMPSSTTIYYARWESPGCSSSSCAQTTVNVSSNAPTVQITNPAAVCSPATVDLTASAVTAGSSPDLTFTYWTDSGALSSLSDPSEVATSNTYYIEGTNTGNYSDIEPVIVTINPAATLSITNPAAVCYPPTTVDLTASAVNGGSSLNLSYWTDSGASSALSSPWAVATSGLYYIKGTDNITGCSVIEPVTATVNPTPTVSITSPAAVCYPNTIDLTAPAVTSGSDAGLTLTYWTNSGASLSLSNPNAVGTLGTYYIKGTNSYTCYLVEPVAATINPLPTVVTHNPSAVCSPGTVNLTATAVTIGSDAGLTFTYWTDSGASLSLSNPGAVASSGTYYIEGTNSNTCTKTQPVTVTVNSVNLVLTNQSACSPGTVNLKAAGVTAGSDAGLTFSYWTNSGATTTLTAPTTVGTSGTYYIKGTNTTTACTSIDPITVTIGTPPTVYSGYATGFMGIPLPIATCYTLNAVNLCSMTTTATNYTSLAWTCSGCNGTISNPGSLTSATYTPVASDYSPTDYNSIVFTLTAYANAGCANATSPLTLDLYSPVVSISAAGPTSFCPGGSVVLNATTGDNFEFTYTYQWQQSSNGTSWTSISGATTTAFTATATNYYDVLITMTGGYSNGCTSASNAILVTVNNNPTVDITNPAAVCSPATVDLTGTAVTSGSDAGLTFTYWTDSGASTPLGTPTAAGAGTYYIKGTNSNTCHAIQPVTVTVNSPPDAPTGTSPQTFCSAVNPTIASLSVTGSNIIWYDASSGGTVLATSTALSDGTTYYASQTTNGCESTSRHAILATVYTTPGTPTGSSTQTFCSAANPTVASLSVTGSNITWYDASTGGNVVTGSTALSNGTTYYASQSTNGCVSTSRLAVTATVYTTPGAPTGSSPQTFCSAANPTVADLAATASGTIIWYDASTGEGVLDASTALSNGTTYYAGQTANGCESSRFAVTATVYTTPAVPTGDATQAFCSAANPTVGDLSATASGTVIWYDASTGEGVLDASTALSDGTTYYAGQTANGCESSRLAVTATVNTTPDAPGVTTPVTYCQGATASQLTATGSNLLWYTGPTGGTGNSTAPTPVTTSTGTTDYYVSQTVNSCEGLRADIAVTVNACNITWGGSSDNHWDNSDNWPNGTIPTINNPVTIPATADNQPTIYSGNTGYCQSLTINPGASLTVAGTFVCEGAMLIESNSSGTGAFSQSDGATVTIGGTATVQRYIQDNVGYHYISSPLTVVTCNAISGFTLSAANSGFWYDPNKPIIASKFPNMWRIDEAHTHAHCSDDLNSWYAPAGSEAMTPGLGYTINTSSNPLTISVSKAGSNGNPFNAGSIAPGVSVEALSTDVAHNNLCLDLYGVINGAGCANVGTGPTNGWHLIANPYPSPVDWNALVDGGGIGTNIQYGFYIFKPTSQYMGVYGNYHYYDGVATTTGAFAPSRYIPSMQSFFIQNAVPGPSSPALSFANAYRNVTGDALNASYYKEESSFNGKPGIALQGYNNAQNLIKDKAVIMFGAQNTEGSVALSPCFGVSKLKNTDDNVPNIYSVSSNSGLALQGISEFKDDMLVPLGFDVNTDGEYTINASEIQNFPAGTHVYLVDLKNNGTQDLTINPKYTFAINKGDAGNRFYLKFVVQGSGMGANAEMFDAYSNNNMIVVNYNNPDNAQAYLSLFNVLGQNVRDNIVISNGTYRFTPGVAPGAYMIRLITNDKVYIKRLYIQ